MRKFLTLTCCVGLASLVGAAQNNNQNNNNPQGKKKGQQQQQQQAVMPQGGGGKKYKQAGAGPHNKNFQQPNTVGNYNAMGKKGKKSQNWQGQGQGGLNTGANTTKFNKSKNLNANKNLNMNKNLNANKNFKFQKKQFNLQTNNKNYVVNKYKTINYNANYKIAGAQNWHGSQYVVFQNYHPQWHDTWWWNWHHPHLTFIYGGWYYWNSSYWYPAWGYAPNSVYVYDGPIYSSSPSEDPGQVVANVQSALQEQGYYQGEIDGVLGPQTRAALAEFQSAQGLEPTGAVDEPTLQTLGMV
jgi:Putative peptidoglycan binding domain